MALTLKKATLFSALVRVYFPAMDMAEAGEVLTMKWEMTKCEGPFCRLTQI